MAAHELLVDLKHLDFDRPLATIDEIRAVNPQRHEMEQLTAILYEDSEAMTCAAYKDIGDREFWVRGHMPEMPLMPGVMMLESVAQLASYFTQKNDLLGVEMVGFGGLDDVRFRGFVLPGKRLIVMVRLEKSRRGRMIVASFQGVVDGQVILDGTLRGIPIPVEMLKATVSA